jgi:hypothetical protein
VNTHSKLFVRQRHNQLPTPKSDPRELVTCPTTSSTLAMISTRATPRYKEKMKIVSSTCGCCHDVCVSPPIHSAIMVFRSKGFKPHSRFFSTTKERGKETGRFLLFMKTDAQRKRGIDSYYFISSAPFSSVHPYIVISDPEKTCIFLQDHETNNRHHCDPRSLLQATKDVSCR